MITSTSGPSTLEQALKNVENYKPKKRKKRRQRSSSDEDSSKFRIDKFALYNQGDISDEFRLGSSFSLKSIHNQPNHINIHDEDEDEYLRKMRLTKKLKNQK